jgi:imidazolonepropionase-like amidohydrolase
MNQILLRGRLIDAVSNDPIDDGAVLIEGQKIIYAGSYADCPKSDADVYLADNGTILPGFIDVHAHLTGEEDAGSFASGKLLGDQLVGAVYEIGLLLDAGFTGIRDMSEAGLYLSRGVDRGVIRGPRIVPGGKVLGITSGHVDFNPSLTKEYYNATDHLSMLCDGPDDCVRAVREQFRSGARFIKICATGGVSSPTDRVDDVQFSPEELRAIVGEAKRHHSYVCAHCTGYEGAYQALLAGVECIEHGVMLTQREIDLMAEKNVPLVSTLSVSLGVANIPGLPDWMHEKAVNCAEANKRTIAMAREAGVSIALGTDYSNSPNTPYLENGREFEAMVRAGLTPMESIKAGTINAARVMRMEDQIGSLEAGKLADVVLVDGNPLEDIFCLTHADHVKLVIKDGKIEKNIL